MKVVGVHGLTGGAGATTVCAGLAVAMNQFGLRTIAMDLQLDNCLGLHFGMPLSQTDGLLSLKSSAAIEDVVYASDEGYPFIPFGRVLAANEELALKSLEQRFSALMAPLLARENRLLLVDVPRTPGPLQQWVYQHAHMVINVLQPEPRLASALIRFAAHGLPLQQKVGASRVLINQMAPNLAVARDSSDYLHGVLNSEMLLPVTVHRDQHAVEAFAAMQPVASFQKSAQVVRDFDALALWLNQFLHGVSDEPQRAAPSSEGKG